MRMTVFPKLPRGKISAIAAKAVAHRAALAAALSKQSAPSKQSISSTESKQSASPITLLFNSTSADIEVTLRGLSALGAVVSRENPAQQMEQVGQISATVFPWTQSPSGILDCGESGSTLRFFLPILPALNLPTEIVGRGRLPDRPLSPLREELCDHGAKFSAEKLPFVISGQLRGGDFFIRGDVSSQYVTGLLFALPLLNEDSVVHLTSPLQSRGYVDITLAVLRDFGVAIDCGEDNGGEKFLIRGRQTYVSRPRYLIEGDWSNAAFFLAANFFGAQIDLENLREDSYQPDRVIVEHLAAMKSPGNLTVDVAQCPDLLPIMSVVAAGRNGETAFVNAARLRLKESDRLAVMAEALRAIGGDASETPAELRVRGKRKLRGGEISSHNDHRVAMAMTVAALICENPIIIDGAEAVEKSYPHFFADWNKLGGDAR